jgi:cation transport protein ChaC
MHDRQSPPPGARRLMKLDLKDWIFAYGSLMWRPGFAYLERQPALLRGYHRAFCIYSHVTRGTPERPGLVLGLDRGGACRGLAFRIDPARHDEVFGYLREREQSTRVYLERQPPIELPDRRRVRAHAYVADPRHHQYAGRLPLDTAARLILQGVGRYGKNREYLESTVSHLDALGIADGPAHRLLEAVEALARAARPGRPRRR